MLKTRYEKLMTEYKDIITIENQGCITEENLNITCKLATEMHFIKDLLMMDQERAKGVYCHKECKTALDNEMHRVLMHGNAEHMERLNHVISRHFEMLVQSNPKLYDYLLEEMKKI